MALPRIARRWDAILRRENYNLRLWILTLSGAVLETLVLIPALPAAEQFVASLSQPQTPAPPSAQVYLILYYIIPVAFSIPASLAFTPKRLVSPLNILVGAAAGYTLLDLGYSLDKTTVLTQTTLDQIVLSAIILWFFLTFLGLVIGFAETWVVRMIVGLNGDLPSLDLGRNQSRKTFLIPVSIDRLSRILEDDTNLQAWDVLAPIRKKRVMTVRSNATYRIQIIMLAKAFDANNSELATVAFEKSFYSILQSDVASQIRDGMVRDMAGQLNVVCATMNADSCLSARVASLAMSPTKSALAPLSEGSKFYLGLVLSTLVLLVVLAGEFYIHQSSEFFASSLVAVLIAFIVELAPTIKEQLENSATDEAEA